MAERRWTYVTPTVPAPRWRRPRFRGGMFTVTVFGRYFYVRYSRG